MSTKTDHIQPGTVIRDRHEGFESTVYMVDGFAIYYSGEHVMKGMVQRRTFHNDFEVVVLKTDKAATR